MVKPNAKYSTHFFPPGATKNYKRNRNSRYEIIRKIVSLKIQANPLMNFIIKLILSKVALISCPHEKVNRCLTDVNRCLTDILKKENNINRYLTNTENQFYKISVISIKYRLSIGLYRLYRLNIDLLRFLP